MADTRTEQTMVDRIANELLRDDLSTTGADNGATIDNCIKDAIYYYQRETFFVNERIDTSHSTVALVNTDVPPADMLEIDQLDCTANNVNYTLVEKTYQTLDTWDAQATNPVKGVPRYWAMFNTIVRFYPTPDRVYPLTYIMRTIQAAPASLSEANNFWMTTAEDLIRNRAKFLMNMGIIRDTQAAELDRNLEKEALYKIMEQTAGQLFTGRIKPCNL